MSGPVSWAIASSAAELLLELQHDPVRRLLADAGDRLEARGVLARDRAAQFGRRRAGDDRERDLRPDAAHGEELDEQLALAPVGEAVELERVLADVGVRLDGDLVGRVALADRGRSRVDEIADAADVEDEPFRRVGDGLAAEARDHARSVRTGTDVLSRRPRAGAAARARGRSRPRARRPRGAASATRGARGSSSPSAASAPSRPGRSRRSPA